MPAFDPSDWTLLLDPTNPATLFPPPVQLIVAGDTIQRGASSSTRTGPGYGLRIVDNEVHSFEADGDTLRLGVRPAPWLARGKAALVSRHVFRSPNYQYRAGMVNPTVLPPESDRLFHDGTRTEYNAVVDHPDDPLALRNGMGSVKGTRLLMAGTVRVEPWWHANDLQAAVVAVHAPNTGPGSPFTSMIGQGRWQIAVRDQRTPVRRGDRTPQGRVAGHIDIPKTAVGEGWGIVIDCELNATAGHLNAWVNPGGRGWQQIVEETGGWGWGYAPTDPDSRMWYTKLANFYSWHNTNADVAAHNWDSRYPVREHQTGPVGFMKDPKGTDPAGLMTEIGSYLSSGPLPTPPEPVPPTIPWGVEMREDLTALQGRVRSLEEWLGRVAAAWSSPM